MIVSVLLYQFQRLLFENTHTHSLKKQHLLDMLATGNKLLHA